MAQEHLDQRRAPRLHRVLEIRYVQPGGIIQSGQAVNISQTGAGLVLDQNVEADELTLEFEGRLALLARTVWQQPLGDGRKAVGVIFEGFHWGQKVALDNYLYELEHQAA